MKTKIALLTATAALSLLASNAQTTNLSPPTAESLPQTVLSYFSSFNTNLTTFGDNRFDLWLGASSMQGVSTPLVNDIGLSYDVWRPASSSVTKLALDLELAERNSGVAGTVVSVQGGLGLSAILWDVKVTLYGNAGDWTIAGVKDKLFGEVGLRIKKGWGQHFYGGVGLGVQFPNSGQVFSAMAGATF